MAIRRTACPTTSRSAFLAPMASRSSSRSISKASRCRAGQPRSEEHTSELQSQSNLVCRLLLEKKKKNINNASVLIEQHRQLAIAFYPAARNNINLSELRAIAYSKQHAFIGSARATSAAIAYDE